MTWFASACGGWKSKHVHSVVEVADGRSTSVADTCSCSAATVTIRSVHRLPDLSAAPVAVAVPTSDH